MAYPKPRGLTGSTLNPTSTTSPSTTPPPAGPPTAPTTPTPASATTPAPTTGRSADSITGLPLKGWTLHPFQPGTLPAGRRKQTAPRLKLPPSTSRRPPTRLPRRCSSPHSEPHGATGSPRSPLTPRQGNRSRRLNLHTPDTYYAGSRSGLPHPRVVHYTTQS